MTVAHEDLVQVWGPDGVVRTDAGLLRSLAFPDDAVRTLSETGLPADEEPLFFAGSPSPFNAARRPGVWLSFGKDYETDFVVEAGSGQVWSMSSSQRHPDRYANSSLPLFVEVLTKVSAARAGFAGLDDPEIDERVERLEEEMRSVDPQAFDDPENWWAVIFEQMRDGLL